MRKLFNTVLMAIPAIIVVFILGFWIQRNIKTELPEPSGQFAVSRAIFEWTDTTRIDSLADKPGTFRKLVAWVWYPAQKSDNQSKVEYLPASWRKAVEKRKGLFSGFFSHNLSKIIPNSIENGNLISGNSTFPVILMKTGIGALTAEYTTFAEELASNGYIVVGSDSPYSTNVVVYSDGSVINDNQKGNPINISSALDRDRRLNRLVTIWTDDTRFILDKLGKLNNDSSNPFYKRLNMSKVGVFGHSLGGATAFRFCNTDKRCKTGVSINGTAFGSVNENKLSKPFMFLMADQDIKADSTALQVRQNIKTIYDQITGSKGWLTVKGTQHFNFSDQALIKVGFLARRSGDIGSIDQERGLLIASTSLRTFSTVI
ncbi:MAG: hypothetical protein HC830_09240 [Bacteroidetes bacterium]|nr:hypothetical protein [Bacteroidota bacterium]